jgi:predicted thioesterase
MDQPSIVVFAWNGRDTAFEHIIWDAVPKFQVILFNFSGNGNLPSLKENSSYDQLLQIRTEFKGRLIKAVYDHLQTAGNYQYIGFVDDDLKLSISGINQMFAIAKQEGLDAFQPSTTKESNDSHAFTLHQPGKVFTLVDWVEIMCPFYRKAVFEAAHEFYENSISSYGLDVYAIPYFQKILALDKTAVIHEVEVTHLRPVTDGDKVLSNGLTSRQEGELIRTEILLRIRKGQRHLFEADFLKRVYEYQTIRYNKVKRDLKRWLGLKAK